MIEVNQEVTLDSGAKFDVGVVNGKKCILLKISDPSQVIIVDAMTTALPVVKSDVMKIGQKTDATFKIFDQIVVS